MTKQEAKQQVAKLVEKYQNLDFWTLKHFEYSLQYMSFYYNCRLQHLWISLSVLLRFMVFVVFIIAEENEKSANKIYFDKAFLRKK